MPERLVGTEYFPWVQKRLLKGEIVKVSDTRMFRRRRPETERFGTITT